MTGKVVFNFSFVTFKNIAVTTLKKFFTASKSNIPSNHSTIALKSAINLQFKKKYL